MAEGEKLMDAGQWQKARAAFDAALRENPGDRRAAELARACQRRLGEPLPGFEAAGPQFDKASGLPREVRVAGLGIAMVLVPGGEFDMGSERFAGSRPVHTVAVEPFYLARFEVTQSEWKALMGSNPSGHQGGKYPAADRMPVDQISWEEAQGFIRRLNEKVPGGGFRLPSEAEWEYAARTGADSAVPLAQVAVFDQPDAPLPVGSRKPNRFGICDLQGNVAEWTSSVAGSYPYDAADGRESTGAAGLRVIRGGSYTDSADLLDPALRHSDRVNRKIRWNGLRVARSVPQ
jgi:formylglycine-generating enzyme required for sulfatase activity